MKQHRTKKIHVGILFGGRSVEHEVSIKSAQNIVRVLDKKKYKITLIGIDKKGRWALCTEAQLFSISEVPSPKRISDTSPVFSISIFKEFLAGGKREDKIDVVFPVLHGSYGEDGTMQGFLEIVGIPFVGAGVLGSAVGMDKDVMKRLLRDAGLPIARFLVYTKKEKKNVRFEEVERALRLPFFVKPANAGSSVGVAKVHHEGEFLSAVSQAFLYDEKILIEEYIKGREIECSVLGNESLTASICGEIVPSHEFYSYEAKYVDERGAALSIPARLPSDVRKKIQDMAVQVCKVLCCEGMARVDFFVTEKNRIYVNEPNTLPGFTAISMYPKLWEASGFPYAKLIDRLIELAMARAKRERKRLTSFLRS